MTKDLLQGISLRDLEGDSSDDGSVEAPSFSPISSGSDESVSSSEVSSDSTSSLDRSDPQHSISSPASPINPSPTTVTVSTPTTTTSSPPNTTIAASSTSSSWKGFKLVGDNVDKNVHASYQRIGRSTQSLHYFHSYAVLDRVDFSGLSDEPPPPSIVDPLSFLPTDSDISVVERDMCILISR